MYQTILVPLDGSDLAEAALAHAEAIAERFRAEVVLFRALAAAGAATSTAMDAAASSGQEAALAHDYLMQIRRGLQTKGIRASTAIGEGRAADAILRYAESASVSIIVVSSHGRGGLSRVVAGSVADELMRRSMTPVLVVRNLRAGAESEAFAPELPFQTGFAT